MKVKKYIGKEDDFQKACARYLDSLGVLWFHPPNEIKAKVQYMVKRKQMGVKSGLPDICILEPNKLYKGLFVELKVKYNTTTENQNRWIVELNKRGYKAFATWSLDEFIEEVDNYLK